MVRFAGEYRLLSSLVNAYPPSGTFRYEQYEKAFDAHWDEIKALPDCVSIEVAAHKNEHRIYREIRADEEYRHYFDQAKISLTSRYGESIEETLKTPSFAILNEKGLETDCKVTNQKAVKADEVFVKDFVKKVMQRAQALCQLYKPGYQPGQKEC
jgi:hypothetical protein